MLSRETSPRAPGGSPPSRRRSALLLCFAAALAAVACGGSVPANDAPRAPLPDATTKAPAPAGLGPPELVECGDFTTCALATGGVVRCWGANKRGELGDGGGVGLPRGRVVEGIGHAKTVALASQFACALGEDGKVRCWGTGRIANDGRWRERSTPVEVAGVTGAVELVASGAIACARAPSGVSCWGPEPRALGEAPKRGFRQITAGFTHACGLDAGGGVECWGATDWSPRGVFGTPPLAGALSVSSGDRHACVVTAERKVACWGMNDAGQLGIKPDGELHKKPVVVPFVKGVDRVVSGEASTCAHLDDGSVQCWGANGEGELGLGTRTPYEGPSRVAALSNVKQLCLATQHACALERGGRIRCWGANGFGQLGDGSTERRLAPVAVAW